MQLDLDVCNKICQPSSRSSAREREPAHDLDQKAACYKDLDAIGFGKTQDDCMIKMRLDHRRANKLIAVSKSKTNSSRAELLARAIVHACADII